ncbi:MAG: ATPase (AAA+ superfamily) [Elusimicrobia bacterium]|nr:MAG: ATPase (AAA+ superfamily) [Elusimicrobiota bacterium]KAF0157005.1 MAG: ATPase (AAA+ superfamily) [Elusimicrobiota bacterium]
MNNPFVYGEIAVGQAFTGRKKELIDLSRGLQSGERILLISPRRFGKTSLLANLLEGVKSKGLLTAYIDLYRCASLEQFAAVFTDEVLLKTETELEAVVRMARETIPLLRPKITLEQDGQLSASLDLGRSKNEQSAALSELFNAAEKMAKRRNKRLVIALDEFQEVTVLGGEPLEKLMRAAFQTHHHVSYIFSGSRQHLIADMVNSRDRAFYKPGRVVFLGKIMDADFRIFIRERFKAIGVEAGEAALKRILAETDAIPYYVQCLCSFLWNKCREGAKLTEALVSETSAHIADTQAPFYTGILESIPMKQRRLLQVVAQKPAGKLYSGEIAEGYKLGPLSSVQVSVGLLLKKGLIEKENGGYVFSDPFFKIWVLKNMGSY